MAAIAVMSPTCHSCAMTRDCCQQEEKTWPYCSGRFSESQQRFVYVFRQIAGDSMLGCIVSFYVTKIFSFAVVGLSRSVD